MLYTQWLVWINMLNLYLHSFGLIIAFWVWLCGEFVQIRPAGWASPSCILWPAKPALLQWARLFFALSPALWKIVWERYVHRTRVDLLQYFCHMAVPSILEWESDMLSHNDNLIPWDCPPCLRPWAPDSWVSEQRKDWSDHVEQMHVEPSLEPRPQFRSTRPGKWGENPRGEDTPSSV